MLKKLSNYIYGIKFKVYIKTHYKIGIEMYVKRNWQAILLVVVIFLSACDPLTLTLGGAAIVGTEVTCNQNGISGAVSDSVIQASINKVLFENDRDIFYRVELSVKHGAVVVIGYMRNEEQRRKAMQLVRSVKGPRIVFDETKIDSMSKAESFAKDISITPRIKTSLAADGNVQSLNYDITTVRGIVYICGTAQSAYERNIVLDYARNTSGVIKVVSYISINKNENISIDKNKNKKK